MGAPVLPLKSPLGVDDSHRVVAVETVERVKSSEKAAQAILQEGGRIGDCKHHRGSRLTRARSIKPEPDQMCMRTPGRLSQACDLSLRRRDASSGLRQLLLPLRAHVRSAEGERLLRMRSGRATREEQKTGEEPALHDRSSGDIVSPWPCSCCQ
jgi:hypothetical protein